MVLDEAEEDHQLSDHSCGDSRCLIWYQTFQGLGRALHWWILMLQLIAHDPRDVRKLSQLLFLAWLSFQEPEKMFYQLLSFKLNMCSLGTTWSRGK